MLHKPKGAGEAGETELEEEAPHDSRGTFMCVIICSE